MIISGENNQTYLFSANGLFLKELIAPDGAAIDLFGSSVAISSSGILIGDAGDDEKGTDSGAAYLYSSSGEFLRKILAPDGEFFNFFGRVVAMSTNLIIGDRDSVYIFTSSGEYKSRILDPTEQSGDDSRFGWSLAVTEDFIVVGAAGDNNDRGVAFLYNMDGVFQKPCIFLMFV